MINVWTTTGRSVGSFGRGRVHRPVELRFLGDEIFADLLKCGSIQELASSLEEIALFFRDMVLEWFLKHSAASRPFLRLGLSRRSQIREQAVCDVLLDRPFQRFRLALFRLFERPVEDLFLGAAMRRQSGFELLEKFPPFLAVLASKNGFEAGPSLRRGRLSARPKLSLPSPDEVHRVNTAQPPLVPAPFTRHRW